MANMLAAENIEVWQSNIVDALFMTQSTASIKQLNGNYVADLIEHAHKTTGKKIVVTGDSYATISATIGFRTRVFADNFRHQCTNYDLSSEK